MRSLRLPAIIAVFAIVLVSCGKAPVITPDKAASERLQDYNRVTGKKDETSPTHGTMTRMWYGALVGVNETPANGVGFLRAFEDQTFTGVINLNILPRKDSKHLVVWMAKSGGTDPVRVGELQSIIGDARHSASFELKQDLTDHTAVLITLESTAEPATPGTHAAEGMLKEVAKK